MGEGSNPVSSTLFGPFRGRNSFRFRDAVCLRGHRCHLRCAGRRLPGGCVLAGGNGRNRTRHARRGHNHPRPTTTNGDTPTRDTVTPTPYPPTMTEGPDFEAIQSSSRHGTRSRYKAGCRCDDCRASNAAYQRRRREELRAELEEVQQASARWLPVLGGVVIVGGWVWAILRRAKSLAN